MSTLNLFFIKALGFIRKRVRRLCYVWYTKCKCKFNSISWVLLKLQSLILKFCSSNFVIILLTNQLGKHFLKIASVVCQFFAYTKSNWNIYIWHDAKNT